MRHKRYRAGYDVRGYATAGGPGAYPGGAGSRHHGVQEHALGEIATRLQAELEAMSVPAGAGSRPVPSRLSPTVLALITAVARLEAVVAELELRLDELSPQPLPPARRYPPARR